MILLPGILSRRWGSRGRWGRGPALRPRLEPKIMTSASLPRYAKIIPITIKKLNIFDQGTFLQLRYLLLYIKQSLQSKLKTVLHLKLPGRVMTREQFRTASAIETSEVGGQCSRK